MVKNYLKELLQINIINSFLGITIGISLSMLFNDNILMIGKLISSFILLVSVVIYLLLIKMFEKRNKSIVKLFDSRNDIDERKEDYISKD